MATPRETLNPYAPPAAPIAPTPSSARPGTDFLRDDDRLVVRSGTVLPAVCIATGEPVNEPLEHRKLQWIPRWVILVAILVSPLVAAIVMLIVRRRGELTFGLGPAPRKKRRTALFVGLGVTALSIGIGMLGLDTPEPLALVVGALGFVAGIIVAAAVGQPFRVVKIENDFIYLKVTSAALAAFDRLGASSLVAARAPATTVGPEHDAYRQKLHADLDREF